MFKKKQIDKNNYHLYLGMQAQATKYKILAETITSKSAKKIDKVIMNKT